MINAFFLGLMLLGYLQFSTVVSVRHWCIICPWRDAVRYANRWNISLHEILLTNDVYAGWVANGPGASIVFRFDQLDYGRTKKEETGNSQPNR